jgi:hypothetical protein
MQKGFDLGGGGGNANDGEKEDKLRGEGKESASK